MATLIITPAYATTYGNPQILYYSFDGGAVLIITRYELLLTTMVSSERVPTIGSRRSGSTDHIRQRSE
eukprot:12932874-Prorocentrum_lima.AAC.1